MGTIILIVLVLLLIGALPAWPHSRNWGYAPSGITGLIVIILLIMLFTGRL
jgi:fumarate reductase subunit D